MKVKQDLWIARDGDGSLYIYDGKPSLLPYGRFCSDGDGDTMELDRNLFLDVTCENSPQRVHIKRIKLV
jgi:hypothetical protein